MAILKYYKIKTFAKVFFFFVNYGICIIESYFCYLFAGSNRHLLVVLNIYIYLFYICISTDHNITKKVYLIFDIICELFGAFYNQKEITKPFSFLCLLYLSIRDSSNFFRNPNYVSFYLTDYKGIVHEMYTSELPWDR